MRSDLDRLMEEARLDALVVMGRSIHNPPMAYFVGRAHLALGGLLLKKRGQPPLLFHEDMERDEAARTGLATQDLSRYNWVKLLEQAQGDTNEAGALRYQRIFEDHDVRGRVGVYGKVDVGPGHAVLRRVAELCPQLEIVGETRGESVLARARSTKDEHEVARIRRMGQITTSVAGEAAEFLTSQRIESDTLVDRQGRPITIGEVKARINLWLAQRGAENPEGTIFAIGRDAGVPHSSGNDDEALSPGKTIVFDLFPTEAGGGYFYDFTRTWCLEHAPEEVERTHQDVRDVYNHVYETLRADAACREFQIRTCEQFEARGHPTVMSDPKTLEGYVHSLGHGLGLEIHEAPSLSHLEHNRDRLLPGTVFTFEPGLYYPQRGYGVRLENTLWVRPDGTVETLAEYPMDLVLKMKRGPRGRKVVKS